jgi:hypothetical protein
MGRRSTSRKLSAAKSQELQVAAAVAREAVVQLHADHALELIRCAAGRVTELRMLQIYIRLLELAGPAEEVVANRVLAALGRTHTDAEEAGVTVDPVDTEYTGDVASEGSLLRTLRRRLRGRVHDALRRTVELRVGVVNAMLLQTHVAHARGIAALLADTHGVAEACRRYTELVQMPSALAGVLYVMVLDRIAAEEAGSGWPAAQQASAGGSALRAGAQHSALHSRLQGRGAQRGQRTRAPA